MNDWKVWIKRYKAGSVEDIYVLCINGKSDAEDFLDWLYEKDQDAWEKFDYVFERKCAGHSVNWKMFHEIKTVPGAYEFKAEGQRVWRIYCFRKGNRWILTHGVKKPKDKKVTEEGKKCIEKKKLLEKYGS